MRANQPAQKPANLRRLKPASDMGGALKCTGLVVGRALLSPVSVVVLAVLIGAFLRFWRLDSLPPGLYHDEAYYGLDALSLLQGKTFPIFYEGWELYANDAHAERPPTPTRYPIFFEGNYGREPLHVYLIALSIKLWGPTPFAIRFVVATTGTLAVLTTYLAAGALFGVGELRGTQGNSRAERIAYSVFRIPISPIRNTQYAIRNTLYLPAFAALALAILYPALTFSRFGIRAMDFVPIETLTVYCFWRGIGSAGKRQWGWFAAAGFCLGLGVYTYAAARLFPLVFIAFVPLWFWLERPALRRYGPAVGLMALVSAVTAAPMLLFFARYPYFFIFRTGYVANKGLGTVEGKPWLTWLGNIGRVFAGLFWQGETHLRHNLPGRPYLDPIQAVFFVLGIGRVVTTRTLRLLFLLLWLLVMLLPTLLSGDAPHFGRMTGAAPAVAILIAVGAVWLIELGERIAYSVFRIPITHHASRITHHAIRNTQYAILPLLFLVSTLFTFRDYFGRYANHPELAEAFYVGDWELGRAAAGQPAETTMYLTPTQEEMATIYYALEGARERLHSYYGPGGVIPAGRPQSPALYFVRPSEPDSLARLADFFPAGTAGAAGRGYQPFYLPAAAPRTPQMEAADVSWAGQIRLAGWSQNQAEGRLVVTLAWQAEAAIDRPYTAFVHLLAEDGTLVAQLDRPPAGYPTTDWRPGEIVIDRFTVPIPPDVAPGVHSIATGWYYLPTLERLGEAAVLATVTIDD